MEPLHNPHERAHRTHTYTPQRSRWPGLIGAAAIVAAVLGVTMWAQHDDARKMDAPPNARANVTTPAPAGADSTGNSASADTNSAHRGNTDAAPNNGSQVATQPPPARQ
jgi:hypothetical protein